MAVAEIEPFPCQVLAHHFPDVPNLGDITKITHAQIKALGQIDIVVLGFPCQDVSIAGQRKGLKNADGTLTRSGLFFTAMQIIDWSEARWIIGENVPGLFSTDEGRAFASVVGELAGTELDVPGNGWRNAGVALGPKGLVEWFVLDAQFTRVATHPRAVPQRRRRVFIVRDSGDWQRRPPLFLERQGMRGNPAPRRESWQGTAPTLSARTKGGGGLGTDFDLDGGLTATECADSLRTSRPGEGGISVDDTHLVIPESSLALNTQSGQHHAPDTKAYIAAVCGCLSDGAHMGGGLNGQDAHSGRIISQTVSAGDARTLLGKENSSHAEDAETYVTHSLTSNGFDASEDGSGRGTPIVPVAFAHQQGGNIDLHMAEGDALSLQRCQGQSIAFSCKDHGADASEIAPTLRSMGHSESHANGGGQIAVAVGIDGGDVAFALRAEGSHSGDKGDGGMNTTTVAMRTAVRRLTPLECERLQGFPDNWTLIPIGKKGMPAKDGPRYKSLGNSMACNCMFWIGQRIQQLTNS